MLQDYDNLISRIAQTSSSKNCFTRCGSNQNLAIINFSIIN